MNQRWVLRSAVALAVSALIWAPISQHIAAPGLAVAAPNEPRFRSYDEAVAYVRSHYKGEALDTSRSSWITSAEYYPAGGRGYMILGMSGKPYIFARVPLVVWQGFRSAPSLGRYYNQNIKGRYRFTL